jgi:hypothetical protein
MPHLAGVGLEPLLSTPPPHPNTHTHTHAHASHFLISLTDITDRAGTQAISSWATNASNSRSAAANASAFRLLVTETGWCGGNEVGKAEWIAQVSNTWSWCSSTLPTLFYLHAFTIVFISTTCSTLRTCKLLLVFSLFASLARYLHLHYLFNRSLFSFAFICLVDPLFFSYPTRTRQ